MPPLVVDIAALRRAAGLEGDDATSDEILEDLEARAVAWVEEQFERRFREPVAHIEYRWGNNSRSLFLRGNIADPAAASAVTVRERTLLNGAGDWESFTSFEIRNRNQLLRTDGMAWSRAVEYEITYQNGYEDAPGDIQSLILELSGIAFSDLSSGGGEITSEKIGDYSYTVAAGATGGAGGVLSTLSDTGSATYHRWRQRHI